MTNVDILKMFAKNNQMGTDKQTHCTIQRKNCLMKMRLQIGGRKTFKNLIMDDKKSGSCKNKMIVIALPAGNSIIFACQLAFCWI